MCPGDILFMRDEDDNSERAMKGYYDVVQCIVSDMWVHLFQSLQDVCCT